MKYEGKLYGKIRGRYIELEASSADYDTCKIIAKESTQDAKKAIELLSDLAGLQNGAPLARSEKEWKETMDEVWSFLNEKEGYYS